MVPQVWGTKKFEITFEDAAFDTSGSHFTWNVRIYFIEYYAFQLPQYV